MKTSVNIKMEEEVRDAAKKLFEYLGLDMTTAVNIFVKTAIREQGIPFEISAVDKKQMQREFEKNLRLDICRAGQEYDKGESIPFDQAITQLGEKYGW